MNTSVFFFSLELSSSVDRAWQPQVGQNRINGSLKVGTVTSVSINKATCCRNLNCNSSPGENIALYSRRASKGLRLDILLYSVQKDTVKYLKIVLQNSLSPFKLFAYINTPLSSYFSSLCNISPGCERSFLSITYIHLQLLASFRYLLSIRDHVLTICMSWV